MVEEDKVIAEKLISDVESNIGISELTHLSISNKPEIY